MIHSRHFPGRFLLSIAATLLAAAVVGLPAAQPEAAIEETIIVTSESPLLDDAAGGSRGTTVTSVELEKIPTARDPWSVLNQTPGVLSDRINVGGNESGQPTRFGGVGADPGSGNIIWFLDDDFDITDDPFNAPPNIRGRTGRPLDLGPDAFGSIFTDGFESGDTSSWTTGTNVDRPPAGPRRGGARSGFGLGGVDDPLNASLAFPVDRQIFEDWKLYGHKTPWIYQYEAYEKARVGSPVFSSPEPYADIVDIAGYGALDPFAPPLDQSTIDAILEELNASDAPQGPESTVPIGTDIFSMSVPTEPNIPGWLGEDLDTIAERIKLMQAPPPLLDFLDDSGGGGTGLEAPPDAVDDPTPALEGLLNDAWRPNDGWTLDPDIRYAEDVPVDESPVDDTSTNVEEVVGGIPDPFGILAGGFEPAAPSGAPDATDDSPGGATPTAPDSTVADNAPPPSSPDAPTPNAADAAPPTEVADPDCDPCVPIAAKLRDALQRQQDLEQELEDVEARLDQLPDALDEAERDQQALEDEYQRRLEDTRVSSGEREGRYYEVGGTVFITVGTMQGDTYVPDEIPDPNAPQDLGDASGPRRSPYMNRLRERIDEAASAAEDLRAEQTKLTDRQTQLAADVAAVQAAVDQLRQELEDCLKTCGQPGSMNPQPTMTTGGTTPLGGGPRGPGGSIFVGNPTDFLSGVNLYALTTPDGVPYALAPPREDTEDRYQLFIAWFIRVGQSPAATPPDALDATPGDVRRQPPPAPWARLAHRLRDGVAGAFSLLTPPPVYAVAPAPRLAPGTRVWLGAAGQDRPSPAVSFVATGASSGDALTVELAETTGTAVEVVAPDGLVLQAVRSGRGTRVSQGGGPVTTAPVTGFCLEYEKPPPPADTLYQVAPASVQARYQAMRPILEAGRTLAEAGLLNPDSDLASYATFIQQWSVWTRLEDWDQGEFTRAFIDRTRKNVENAGQRFTDQMRSALEGAAPNRFTDILKVLVEAEGLVDRPPFSLAQF